MTRRTEPKFSRSSALGDNGGVPPPKGPRRRGKKKAGRKGGPPAGRDLETALAGMQRHVSAPDGEWIVRAVRGSERTYRCPGCDQLIAGFTPHTVAWRADDVLGPEHGLNSRRHWHDACFTARGRRGPGYRPGRRR